MTDIHLGQPTGAELERVRARLRRWNRRRYIAWGAFGAVALLALLANALAVDWLHFLVPLAIWLLLLAGANSALWWRCPGASRASRKRFACARARCVRNAG